MENLEEQLKNALARKDAPAWLEAKVMAATRELPQRGSVWQSLAHGGRVRWASAVAVIALAVSGIAWQHQRAVSERAAGEAAKARLELALRITSTKLRKIEQTLNKVERDN